MLNLQSIFLLLASGVMMGLNAPALGTNLIGCVAYVPLLIVLEQWRFQGVGRKGNFWKMVLACLVVAVPAAVIGNTWMVHSIHVFGHQPLWLSILVTGLGYGLEVSLVLVVCFVLPLLWCKRLNQVDLIFRLFWAIAADIWYPRLFHWSFGGLTFDHVPLISQVADLTGTAGLGFFSIGSNFLLLLAWRIWVRKDFIQPVVFFKLSLVFLLLTGAALVYGQWRAEEIQIKPPKSSMHVVSIQPNFSLQDLASNKELAYSKRKINLDALLKDSRQALKQLPDDDLPRMVVWPESTFPHYAFFDFRAMQKVKRFARSNETHVVFQSVDAEWKQGTQFNYSISLLIGPNGELLGRYNKIFLIPFGEYIPLGEAIPVWRRLVLGVMKNTSEFNAGTEYTVFKTNGGIQLSATICFDAFSPHIIRKMTNNGADFVINLTNLAWFGKTNATVLMESMLWWHAIENRIPVLYASNNGQSLLIGPAGQDLSNKLPLFEQGAIVQTLHFQEHTSFYSQYAQWIRLGSWVFVVLSFWLAWNQLVFLHRV